MLGTKKNSDSNVKMIIPTILNVKGPVWITGGV